MRIVASTAIPRALDERSESDARPAAIKVAIIDDDEAMCRALARLLTAFGLQAVSFPKPRDFLNTSIRAVVDCVLIDLCMPEIDGLGLQQILSEEQPQLSVVFITGIGNVPASVEAMKNGAVDFLLKPVNAGALVRAVTAAAERSRARKASYDRLITLKRAYQKLTPRERQIFGLIVDGSLNKQAAADLGISEKTVKVHRARVMRKMSANSLAELARMAERLGTGAAAVHASLR
ncbi:MAG TPA: response regulator [Candidatus Binataceae bacterium]|nr:response regulator [Candidatus Binataceae bacterium]